MWDRRAGLSHSRRASFVPVGAPCILASPLAHRTPSTSRHSVTSS
jgi:hypothetical protein